jgi:hypothetical protein
MRVRDKDTENLFAIKWNEGEMSGVWKRERDLLVVVHVCVYVLCISPKSGRWKEGEKEKERSIKRGRVWCK